MNTFLKLVILTLVVLLLVHLWPLVAVPFGLVGLAILVLGAATAGGVAVVLTVGLALLGAVLAVVLSVTAALSPIWIPVVLLLAVISLCKRKSRVAV